MGRFKYYFAVFSAVGGSAFNHGYHIGIFNTVSTIIFTWMSKDYQRNPSKKPNFLKWVMLYPFLLGCFSLGAIIGSLLIGVLANIGRKNALLISSGVSLIGLFLLSIANFTESYVVLIVGRVLVGVAVGISSGIAPMYVVEISPFCTRGCSASLYYVVVAISMAFANLLTLPTAFGDPESWPYLFVVGFFPPLIQIISLLFCPESPKYHYFNQDDEDEAYLATEWLRDDQTEVEMEELKEEYNILKETNFTLDQLFTNQHIRSPLIISVVSMAGQQLCGVDVIMYYSNTVIQDYLRHQKHPYARATDCTIGLTLCLFITSTVSMFLSDRIGRKSLLLASFAGMIGCTILLTVVQVITMHKQELGPKINDASVVFLFLHVMSYGLGGGTVPWLYVAELNNHFARPWVVCIATTIEWTLHFILVFYYITIKYAMGSYFLTAFIPSDLVTVVFLQLTMRETMLMTAVDVMDLFYD